MTEGESSVNEKTKLTMGVLIALVMLFLTVTLPLGSGLLIGYGQIVETRTEQGAMKSDISEIKDEIRQIRADQQIVNDRLANSIDELRQAVSELRTQIASKR